MDEDRIELLSTSLLTDHKTIVEQMVRISHSLEIELGWHYLLDLAWISSQIDLADTRRVLDAGAGYGIMQWWLAERGASVISADRIVRYRVPAKYMIKYHVRGWRKEDVSHLITIRDILPSRNLRQIFSYPKKLGMTLGKIKKQLTVPKNEGTVFVYNQDLKNLSEVADNSVDVVVSISALEHNSPHDLKLCIKELMRIIKPGGHLIATLGASKNKDWYHKASQGWCYTESTLRELFDLSPSCPSNYDEYDKLFEELKGCAQLRDNLADFYFQSGDNGMPWGVWNPKYQSVGVIKHKGMS